MKILNLIKTTALVLPLFLLGMGNASAVVLSFSPSDQTVEVSDSVSVDVMVSDLRMKKYVGVFDLTVNYDNSIVGLTGITFDDYLNDGDGTLSQQDDSLSLPGAANAYELSFLDQSWFPDDFFRQDMAAGEFRLFTLTFDALAVGVSALTFDVASYMGDELGFDLQYSAGDGSIRVKNSQGGGMPVPEPGIFALFGIGLLGLALARRRSA